MDLQVNEPQILLAHIGQAGPCISPPVILVIHVVFKYPPPHISTKGFYAVAKSQEVSQQLISQIAFKPQKVSKTDLYVQVLMLSAEQPLQTTSVHGL